jgi:ADP-ribosylglycohydrolase
LGASRPGGAGAQSQETTVPHDPLDLQNVLRDELEQRRVSGYDISGAAAHQRMRERLAGYHWMHVLGNAAVVAAALLWGDGDFERTVGLAVQAGWDTDCNGATVGSVFGAMHGGSPLPAQVLSTLGGRIGGVVGVGPIAVDELADRTCALALGETGG